MKTLGLIINRFLKLNPGTQITLLDQAIVSGSNFLVAIIITRLAGLESYGFFALAWMGLLLASSIHQAFILTPMMSLAPKKEGQPRQAYLDQTQILQILFSIIILLIVSPLVAYADFLLPDWGVSSLFPILPLAIFAYLMQDYYRRYFFITGKPIFALIVDAIAYPGMIVGIVALFFLGLLEVQYVYSMVLTSFGIAALLGFVFAHIPLSFNKRSFGLTLSQHWGFSSWLLGTALLQFFSSNYFLVAAAALLGPVALGALRIAQNLLGLTHVLFQAMENVVPIKSAETFAREGFASMKNYLVAISVKSGAVVLLILVCLALLAKPAIHLVYGSEYTAYSYLLVGYCVFYLSLFPGYPLRYALRSIELTRPIFISYILSTGFSLLCAYPMVQKWELLGVVAGLILTQIIMQGYYMLSLRNYSKSLIYA